MNVTLDYYTHKLFLLVLVIFENDTIIWVT